MEIDSIIGIGIFLVFVAWSFNFYLLHFQEQSMPLQETVNKMQEDIMNYLQIDVYTVPILFSSPDSTSTVLYMAFSWPEGTENSTRIKKAGQSLSCEIQADHVFWQDSLQPGNNYFTMEIANTSVARNCQASFNKSVTNHTRVFAEERTRLVSQSKINSMLAMDYPAFKGILRVSDVDFRVEIQNTTGTIAYGLAIPRNRDVYVPETSNRIWESDEIVNITIAVW